MAEGALIHEGLKAFVDGRRGLIPGDGVDWRILLDKASAMRIGPVLLEVFDNSMLPQEALDRWKNERQITFVRYARAAQAAARLSGILDESGIAHVFTRGLVTAHTLYHNPALRIMTDVDMLISRQDVDGFQECLTRHDIHPEKLLRSQIVYSIDGMVFEVHWSLTSIKRFKSVGLTDAFMNVRMPMDTEYGRIRRLPNGAELSIALAHSFLHHDMEEPRQLLDIALLMSSEETDWRWLGEWSRKVGFARATGFILQFVNKSFGLELDDTLRREFSESTVPAERVFQAYYCALFEEEYLSHYLIKQANLVTMSETMGDKMRQIIRNFSSDRIRLLGKFVRKS
ncbi:nucleotidyltransferase family protein [bacterium]|nr:nucleotidyltransferase family protein [bacterium]